MHLFHSCFNFPIFNEFNFLWYKILMITEKHQNTTMLSWNAKSEKTAIHSDWYDCSIQILINCLIEENLLYNCLIIIIWIILLVLTIYIATSHLVIDSFDKFNNSTSIISNYLNHIFNFTINSISLKNGSDIFPLKGTETIKP